MIRKATTQDVPEIARLSALKRRQYESYQPLFHKEAEGALEKQVLFLGDSIAKDHLIALVHEVNGKAINGFIIGTLVNAPPVYNPGGKVCLVDDFMVEESSLWATVGVSLLNRVIDLGKEKGAVLANVVCGPLDRPKREMLGKFGFDVATESHVKPIK
jgi:hypothetical protein